MTCVFKSNSLEIKKINNNFHLNLKEIENTDKFLLSLRNLNLKKNQKVYVFSSSIVMSLKTFLKTQNNSLTYIDLVSLFISLKTQIELLKNENLGVLFFDLDDIMLVKTESYYEFYFMNPSTIFEMDNEKLKVDKIFNKKNKFLSPELLTVNTIPADIHFTCSYFSLAILVAFCISGNNLDYFNTFDWKEDDLQKILEPIHGTKLFHTLNRALNDSPEKRYLLWI